MLNIILKFFLLIFSLGILTECLYNYPILSLDVSVIFFGIFLFYLLRVLRVVSRKAFVVVLLAGIALSVANFVPHKANSAESLEKLINHKGIYTTLIKGNIYRGIRKDFKVKSLREFVKVSQNYYIDFFLSYFYLIFILSLLLSETSSLRLKLQKLRCTVQEAQ